MLAGLAENILLFFYDMTFSFFAETDSYSQRLCPVHFQLLLELVPIVDELT